MNKIYLLSALVLAFLGMQTMVQASPQEAPALDAAPTSDEAAPAEEGNAEAAPEEEWTPPAKLSGTPGKDHAHDPTYGGPKADKKIEVPKTEAPKYVPPPPVVVGTI
jgi:hypothetical protein